MTDNEGNWYINKKEFWWLTGIKKRKKYKLSAVYGQKPRNMFREYHNSIGPCTYI